jgi:hypothetical protein
MLKPDEFSIELAVCFILNIVDYVIISCGDVAVIVFLLFIRVSYTRV